MIYFRVYPSGLIHHGRHDPDYPPPSMQFRSLCGRSMIGVATMGEPEEWEPQCKLCVAAFERARQTYLEMQERFGGG